MDLNSNSAKNPITQKIFVFAFIFLILIILILQNIEYKKVNSYKIKNTFKANLKIKNKLTNNIKNRTKWIVITSINEPTKQMEKLSIQKDFVLLVVADLKTNPKWSFKSAIYLSVDNQSNLDYKSIKSQPYNSYTRKNIGYLYAIQNGAQFIYDTDDDNEPIKQINTFFDFNEYRPELEYDSDSPLALNPYAHFGQPTIWPRGYPLNKINKPFYNSYICSKKLTSTIQQSVVNGDPDVDAIFRLTKTLENKRIDLYFDESSPSVRIPKYKLTPFNSQNTLYHYKAFWALYLPHSVSFRLTDIWRSYWSQRLLWLLDNTISFYGPNAYQLRNMHSYFSDYKQEKEMFLKTQELIDLLYKWKCKSNKFYTCLLDLSKQMAVYNFWDKSELVSIQNWLNDLNSIGYIEPKIVNNEYDLSDLSIDDFLKTKTKQETKLEKRSQFRVKYTPEFQLPLDFENYYENAKYKFDFIQRQETRDYLKNYCALNFTLNYEINTLKSFKQKSNVLLLITFEKEPTFENIQFFNYYHKISFKNVAFCGKSVHNLARNKSTHFKRFDKLTLISFDTKNGQLRYECVSKAIEMNYNVDGILLISENVLFKNEAFYGKNNSKIIYHSVPKCIYDIESNINWTNDVKNIMTGSYGNKALKKLSVNFVKLLNRSINISEKDFKIYQNYLKQLGLNSNGSIDKLDKVCKESSDLFYVPRNLFYEFNLISSLFSSNIVFFELAVPTILSGLITNKSESIELYRNSCFKRYNNTHQLPETFNLTNYTWAERKIKMCELFSQNNF